MIGYVITPAGVGKFVTPKGLGRAMRIAETTYDEDWCHYTISEHSNDGTMEWTGPMTNLGMIRDIVPLTPRDSLFAKLQDWK